MQEESFILTAERINQYIAYLWEKERCGATIQRYTHHLLVLCSYLGGQAVTKEKLIEWKDSLIETYAPATVNLMLTVVNGFLRFIGWDKFLMTLLKIQKNLFRSEEKELSQEEYARLIHAAEKKENEKLSLIIQTICSTGIRVSELKYITVEAVQTGRAEIHNKGKYRTVFLSNELRRLLKKYLQKQKNTAGAVFVTRNGKPVDRSNIWRDMKKLCQSAKVDSEKVFPHNLRHLFAQTFYSLEKDLSRLADILGHSNISTTRIYTAESGKIHQKILGRMGLVLTT